jgi:hypothetical protein
VLYETNLTLCCISYYFGRRLAMVNPTKPFAGKRSVGVFPHRRDAEHALHELRDSGFPMDRVSVIARDADQKDDIAGTSVSDQPGNKADDGAKVGAISGGALGGLTGLLVGLGTLAIPGVGPILLAGAGATVLATTLAGGAIGAVTGGLVGALIGIGIPEERARVYHDRVARGDYLVMVEGTDEEIARAEAILRHRGIEEYGIYDAPNAATTPVTPTPTTSSTAHHVGMPVGRSKYAIGFFSHQRDAEQAIHDLRAAGFPLNQISLVAQHVERQGPFADLDVHDHLDKRRFGLSEDRFHFLQNRITRGDYLLAVTGTEAEIQQAANILHRRNIQEFRIDDAPEFSQTQVDYDRGFTPNPTEATYTATSPTSTSRVGQRRRAIGTFEHRQDAEAALTELRNSGFSMNQVSLIAKDASHNNAIAETGATAHGNKADEGVKAGVATGGVLGGLGGLLVGLGALAIPGVGPVVLGGAAATALVTALSGGAIGAAAGGLAGGLVGLGIPEDRARFYNERFERGDYLVMVDGTEDELHRAEAVLNRLGIHNWGVFDASDVDTARTQTSRVDTTRTNDSTPGVSHQPDVTIIDRRNEPR